jgi:hypothetical protein
MIRSHHWASGSLAERRPPSRAPTDRSRHPHHAARRRGTRPGARLAQSEQHVDDELVEPLVAVAAARELVERRRL